MDGIEAPASLFPLSEHLQSALASLHDASKNFASADPALRNRGEAAFLALTQSEGALEYACYALERSRDPFVLFQCLNTVLHVLQTLPADYPAPQIPSLTQLRDFLVHLCFSRGIEAARAEAGVAGGIHGTPSNSSWPQYVRSRAYQTAMAVEKRALGLDLAAHSGNRGQGDAEGTIQIHRAALGSQLAALACLPSTWPTAPDEAAVIHSRLLTGLGFVRAVVDEFGLAPGTGNVGSGPSASDRRQETVKGKAVEPGTPVGLSVLEHRWCKAAIQANLLPNVMSVSFNMLYSTLQLTSPWQLTLFPQIVSALERLLSWSFLIVDPFAGLGGGSADIATLLHADDWGEGSAWQDTPDETNRRFFTARKVPEQFYQLLLSTDLVSLVAAAYRHAKTLAVSSPSREMAVTVHRLRQCILLVASFEPENVNAAHGANLTADRTISLITTLKALVQEECTGESTALLSDRGNALLFLAQAYQVVLTSTSARALAATFGLVNGSQNVRTYSPGASTSNSSDASRLLDFLSSLALLGRTIFHFAFLRPRDTDEEDDLTVLAEDTTDTLLGCWTSLTSSVRQELDESKSREAGGAQPDPSFSMMWEAVHATVRTEVVGPYTEGRLLAATMGDADDTSEHGEEAGKDRDIFSDQLITIGMLSRLSAADNLRHLTELFQPLCDSLVAVVSGSADVSSPNAMQMLEGKWEQVHWLLLIVGHLLADDPKGETPSIPAEIVAMPHTRDDPAVRIVHMALELLRQLSNEKPSDSRPTSPQVVETLLWFVARWAASYLLVDSADGSPTNANIQGAFGGDAGKHVLSFLLTSLRQNIELWLSDSDVLQQVAGVLSSFTRSSGIMVELLRHPEMESLVSTIVNGLDALPANTHGTLISAVVSCIYGASSGEDEARSPEAYFHKITNSIESRFSSVIQQPDFARVAQRSDVIAAVQNTLDMLDGLAQSAQPNSATAVYAFISRFFGALVELARTYTGRPEVNVLILRMFRTLAASLDLSFGAEAYMVSGLNSAVWELLIALQADSGSLIPADASSALEEDQPFDGLCIAMELLSELMGASTSEGQDSPVSSVAASWLDASLSPERTADVCLFGWGTLVPLLGFEPLSVPRVRQQFGRLSANLIRTFPGRLLGLVVANGGAPDSGGVQLFEHTIKSLVTSLGAVETDIALGALEALDPFASAAVRLAAQGPHNQVTIIQQALDHFIAHTLKSVLLEPLDSILVDAHLVAIRSLIGARHQETLGGQGALLAALESFCRDTGLLSERDSRAAAMAGTAATPNAGAGAGAATGADETRRAILSEAVQQLAHTAIQSTQQASQNLRSHQSTGAAAPSPLQARAWAKEEKDLAARFCAAAKPVVSRARGALRVR